MLPGHDDPLSPSRRGQPESGVSDEYTASVTIRSPTIRITPAGRDEPLMIAALLVPT